MVVDLDEIRGGDVEHLVESWVELQRLPRALSRSTELGDLERRLGSHEDVDLLRQAASGLGRVRPPAALVVVSEGEATVKSAGARVHLVDWDECRSAEVVAAALEEVRALPPGFLGRLDALEELEQAAERCSSGTPPKVRVEVSGNSVQVTTLPTDQQRPRGDHRRSCCGGRAAGTRAALRVHMIGMPVETYRAMQQYHDELLRELSMTSLAGEDQSSAPRSLLRSLQGVCGELGEHIRGVEEALERAAVVGERTVDLCYEVPGHGLRLLRELDALLEAADEYCRSGNLLTLSVPSEVRALRRWCFDEISAQAAGRAPTPWDGEALESSAQGGGAPAGRSPRATSGRVSKTFPGAPASAGEARHFVAGCVQSWGLESAADAAELLTSEIVTNSILHASGEIEVYVERDEGLVVVSVKDHSTSLPSLRSYDPCAGTGRGLQLVELLSHEWGVQGGVGHKVVWFSLPTG